MSFLNSLKKMLQGSDSNTKEEVHCKELIRLISFAQKTKTLMGGNYGIKVSYSRPNRDQNQYTSPIYAEFAFYDFEYIKFARDYALNSGQSDIGKRMVQHYYKCIAQEAGLTPNDWPYGVDAFDFGRMLTNSDPFGFTTLIPDQNNDDLFTMRINAGHATQNGILASRLIVQECLTHFPNLTVSKPIAIADRFFFTISI